MTNPLSIINIGMFLLFSLLLLWQVSIFVIKTGKIKMFIPFFAIGILFAYFGAFIFFQMYYFAGWGLLKTLEVVAFILLLRELLRISKHE